MAGIRRRTLVALIAIAALLVGGVAFYLVHAQASSRAKLQSELGQRARVAAGLTAADMSDQLNNPLALARAFGRPASQLEDVLKQFQGQSTDPLAAVLDSTGRVLAVVPQSAAQTASTMFSTPDVRRAFIGGASLSDISFYGPEHRPVLRFSEAVSTRYGQRVFVDVTGSQAVAAASAILASAPAVAGAHAYLLDGAGRVLASASKSRMAAPLPDAKLAAAISRRTAGALGPDYFVTAPIHAGSSWRLVFIARRSALFAPMSGSGLSNWLLFGAFVLVVIALLAVGASAFRKSAQLASAYEREHAARRLAHERLHDALTGLPNRALFLDRAEHALDRLPRNGWPLAVLFIDLDHFKRINDSLGHATGDGLLVMFGQRLRSAIRPSDTVSRFGGDEFLVLCEELTDEEDALRVASRIRSVVEKPFHVGERELRVTCCIGIALHRPSDARVPGATLVRDADAAMYSAKASGRRGAKLFDETLHNDAVKRLDTEVALRAALACEELEVHYQPIVELPSGATRGAEALARWTRPGVGPVAPIEFIGIAEECGVIDELGHFVLGTAMDEVGSWYGQGLIDERFMLSVNVSPRQLANPEFQPSVQRLLRDWPLPPSALCLEITESAVVSDPQTVERALSELSNLGVQLAIDDFGVGQSSLEQLVHSLPVDILKLDRAFVADMDQARERAVVTAVAPMAGDLGMAVIAEGVETPEQAETLTRLGYPLAQGYHFGRPAGADRLRAQLAHTEEPHAGVLNPEPTLTT